MSHDFDQFEKDLPRTTGYIVYPKTQLFNARVNTILSRLCHSSHKLYNVLNMIPQQIYLHALQWIHKNYKNHTYQMLSKKQSLTIKK